MTPDAIEDFDGRVEYWEASTETAWVIAEPNSVSHEGPTRRMGRLAELIASVRGSPIESCGSMDLVLVDERGKWRRLMQADETLYLHPDRAHLPDDRFVVGEHDPPDVVLEVDYSTDVRRGKLGLYKTWGFPEIWVEVPARYRARRRPGLTIHVREPDGYREVAESRAFPGWTAAEIHAALSGKALSRETHRVLERVGRRLGALEGTGPDDSPLLRSLRGEARAAGLAEGRTEGRTEGRAKVVPKVVPKVAPKVVSKVAPQRWRKPCAACFGVRGIAMSAGLAGDMDAWSGISQEALVSAAMACEDETDFRTRVRRIRASGSRR